MNQGIASQRDPDWRPTMTTRSEILNPSMLPAARAFRDGLAKFLRALVIIGEAFVEGQERARAAQRKYHFIGE